MQQSHRLSFRGESRNLGTSNVTPVSGLRFFTLFHRPGCSPTECLAQACFHLVESESGMGRDVDETGCEVTQPNP